MEEMKLTPQDRVILSGLGIKPEGIPDYRTPISNQTKKFVDEALKAIPEGKKGALLVIADERSTRLHVAARIGEDWKVALTGERLWSGDVSGQVAIVGAW